MERKHCGGRILEWDFLPYFGCFLYHDRKQTIIFSFTWYMILKSVLDLPLCKWDELEIARWFFQWKKPPTLVLNTKKIKCSMTMTLILPPLIFILILIGSSDKITLYIIKINNHVNTDCLFREKVNVILVHFSSFRIWNF